MRIAIAALAIFAWLMGLVLLFAPAEFYGPAGMDLDELLATLPQATGALWIGLGVMNWFLRHVERQGHIACFAGNLTVHILSLTMVLRTMMIGQGGIAATPAVFIHLVFIALCGVFLIKTLQTPRTSR